MSDLEDRIKRDYPRSDLQYEPRKRFFNVGFLIEEDEPGMAAGTLNEIMALIDNTFKCSCIHGEGFSGGILHIGAKRG